MPIVSAEQGYKLVRDDGVIILKGGFSQLMEVIPQSVARMDVEQAILAAKAARARELRLAARADAVAAREEAVGERERQADAALAEEIRAADEALKGLQDEGDLEPKEAPNLRDADKIEALGGNSEAKGAIEKADQDPAVSPSMIEPDPEPHRPSLTSPGALPKALAMSDEALYGRSFLRNADRKAWRRQMRSAHR
jgi:hypothetical protein